MIEKEKPISRRDFLKVAATTTAAAAAGLFLKSSRVFAGSNTPEAEPGVDATRTSEPDLSVDATVRQIAVDYLGDRYWRGETPSEPTSLVFGDEQKRLVQTLIEVKDSSLDPIRDLWTDHPDMWTKINVRILPDGILGIDVKNEQLHVIVPRLYEKYSRLDASLMVRDKLYEGGSSKQIMLSTKEGQSIFVLTVPAPGLASLTDGKVVLQVRAVELSGNYTSKAVMSLGESEDRREIRRLSGVKLNIPDWEKNPSKEAGVLQDAFEHALQRAVTLDSVTQAKFDEGYLNLPALYNDTTILNFEDGEPRLTTNASDTPLAANARWPSATW